ncbi:MAG: alpha/beta fold hydrolase, partial [Pseudomonadota bacterium]
PRLRHLTPEELTRWNMDRSKAGAWSMMQVMWALRNYDTRAALPKVATSTMVIYGAKTPHKGALAAFGAAIPGAATAEMADCGHFPMLDDPEELGRLVDGFIHG